MLHYVKIIQKMSLPLIQINGKCEVTFYFVCICQKCLINLCKNNFKKVRNIYEKYFLK